MGLILSKGTDKTAIDPETGLEYTIPGKSIFIKGTDIELAECYARIEFVAVKDGKTIKVNFNTYLTFMKFTENKEVETSIVNDSFDFVILPTETQGIEIALQYSVVKFEQLGYTATIDPN